MPLQYLHVALDHMMMETSLFHADNVAVERLARGGSPVLEHHLREMLFTCVEHLMQTRLESLQCEYREERLTINCLPDERRLMETPCGNINKTNMPSNYFCELSTLWSECW